MSPVIFGEVLFDCFDDGSRVLGGAPFNVAWHLTALGQQPLMISSVGKDRPGDEIRRSMHAWRMDERGLQVTSAYLTGAVEVKLQDGEPTYNIVEPVAWDDIQSDQLPNMPAAILLYHGTLALRSATNRVALGQLKHSAAQLFIDVNLRSPWWERQTVMDWLADALWIKLNQHELQQLLPAIASAAEGVQRLFQATRAHWIVLTCGKDGARLYQREGSQWQISLDHAIVSQDAVGAGDAFATVCLLGILHAWPMQLMLHRAQDFAAAVIGLRGATTNDSSFYQDFREKWGI